MFTTTMRFLTAIVAIFGITGTAFAAAPSLLELQVGKETVQGRLIAMDARHCLLMTRAGEIKTYPVKSIAKVSRVGSRFSAFRVVETRDALRRELGRDFDCATDGQYVVCAHGDVAREYAALFDDVYREFRSYFGSRNFRLPEPEFPLVALVFPDHAEFAEYCRQDGVRAVPGLMGYYLRTSNRVALYHPAGQRVSRVQALPLPHASEQTLHPWLSLTENRRTSDPETGNVLRSREVVFGVPQALASGWIFDEPLNRSGPRLAPAADNVPTHADVHASINGSVRDTMIHEATHQIAFNLGLHNRLGHNPKWVVEGLATVFEAPGIRDRSLRRDQSQRINKDRFRWFTEYAQSRRKPNSLGSFVASDDSFRTSVLDAYAESWALSFFLIETRSSKYAAYLREIASQTDDSSSTAEARLASFQRAFGRDLGVLDAEFLRFMDGLQVD